MFWKKKNIEVSTTKTQENNKKLSSYPERSCWLYLSEKYNEILFVPIGNISPWRSRELNKVIVKEWPLKMEELQNCVHITLDNFKPNVAEIENNNDNWFSYKKSKAKSQKSFKLDYVVFQLKTDFARNYEEGEVERFNIKSSSREWEKDRHYFTGTAHLIDADIAQLIVAINKDCQKIRSNKSE